MQYGVSVQNFGEYADPRLLMALAREAEAAGWDGFFLWDHLLAEKGPPRPVVDPWIALAAIAATTERLNVGPLVTPLARRRPWMVAREAVSLDHLSGGRAILGIGLGWPPDVDFARFGEDPDPKTRARKLDESLEVLTGLWSGEPFSHRGEHYRLDEMTFLPGPLQSPRIRIWVAGMWPSRAPFRRAARWDGVVPLSLNVGWDRLMPPSELREIVDYVQSHRHTSAPFDVVLGGSTPADAALGAEIVAPYAEAGLTWWIESIHEWRAPLADLRRRIQQGPPRL